MRRYAYSLIWVVLAFAIMDLLEVNDKFIRIVLGAIVCVIACWYYEKEEEK